MNVHIFARRRVWIPAAAAALALAAGALAATAGSSYGATAGAGGGSAARGLDHVFIVMLENHEADHVIGDPNMPYLTSLASQYGVATDYFGVTHTSEPNYIAATSGDNWWVNNDNGWSAGNQYDHTNIVDELSAAHIPWAAYMQAMPSAGYLPDNWPATGGALYASKHNPFILYNDIRLNPSRAADIKPYTDMAADLNGPNPPRYVWISPDQCTDLHGGVSTAIAGYPETPCPYSNVAGDANDEALKAKADAFVKTAVQTIMSSKAWTGHSVIFVTADESDYDGSDASDNFYLSTAGCCDSPYIPAGDPEISSSWPGGVYGGGSAPMVVISRLGPRHATDSTPSNHYSMLLTIEEGFGLGKLGYTSDSSQVHPLWPLISR
ncbi:MAG TPA: alkaline phosphatase family protein [Trebonia sp.]|nr:alkaline phosphatase family protein [Trebonia sp.]